MIRIRLLPTQTHSDIHTHTHTHSHGQTHVNRPGWRSNVHAFVKFEYPLFLIFVVAVFFAKATRRKSNSNKTKLLSAG